MYLKKVYTTCGMLLKWLRLKVANICEDLIIGKVQTLDWTTGMDDWTGIFWFLILYFKFFWCYFY